MSGEHDHAHMAAARPCAEPVVAAQMRSAVVANEVMA
jgi:hypothetical protein